MLRSCALSLSLDDWDSSAPASQGEAASSSSEQSPEAPTPEVPTELPSPEPMFDVPTQDTVPAAAAAAVELPTMSAEESFVANAMAIEPEVAAVEVPIVPAPLPAAFIDAA